VQPAFMHNGAFTSLRAAIEHHLDVIASARAYRPEEHGLDHDLTGPTGPIEPVLARIDPLVATPRHVADEQLDALVAFLRDGLLDTRAEPENLRALVPKRLPSGRAPLTFEFPSRERAERQRRFFSATSPTHRRSR